MYLNGTKELVLTLGTDSLNLAKWWVDGAFAVHPDMKGHSGVTISFGQGSLLSWSMKQHLNSKSSTETELVDVDDAMPHVLWISYFLEAQDYKVKTLEVY
eukprot:12880814-Ditylum_brightwellii.AAC.1